MLATLSGVSRAQTPTGPSIPMDYCASVNTADMVPLNSDWQSDGRCSGNCTSLSYALAIVQDKNCWCSNLLPHNADRKPLSDCQASCPGYPWDYCGGRGTFGYMRVGGFNPTGTAPAGGFTTTTSSDSTSESTPPPNSVTTITVGGTVRTVTATPSPTGPNDEAVVGHTSTGMKTGSIVGIVIGVVGGLAVIAAFLWLWFSRRRRNAEEEGRLGSSMGVGGGGGGGGSSPGTIATPKIGEVSENRFAPGSTGPPAAAWDSTNKRRSHLMPVDPRLDPFAKGIYGGDQNRSRESFNSLQDNQDYSRRVHQAPRVLRATNPDPDDD